MYEKVFYENFFSSCYTCKRVLYENHPHPTCNTCKTSLKWLFNVSKQEVFSLINIHKEVGPAIPRKSSIIPSFSLSLCLPLSLSLCLSFSLSLSPSLSLSLYIILKILGKAFHVLFPSTRVNSSLFKSAFLISTQKCTSIWSAITRDYGGRSGLIWDILTFLTLV